MAISFCPREKWQGIYFSKPSVPAGAFCKFVRNSDGKGGCKAMFYILSRRRLTAFCVGETENVGLLAKRFVKS